MQQYKVISPYALRDKKGEAIKGKYMSVGELVELDTKNADRLTTAGCVIEMEDRTAKAPENRGRKRCRKKKR